MKPVPVPKTFAEWGLTPSRVRTRTLDAEAELDEMRKTIREYADRFADDRREPDKILCHVQSLRRLAFSRTEKT